MRLSLRKAINDKCKDCIYDPMYKGAGTWKQQIEGCRCKDCPLWQVRPMSASKIDNRVIYDANTVHLSDKNTLPLSKTSETILRR